jgi:hypothetical protein
MTYVVICVTSSNFFINSLQTVDHSTQALPARQKGAIIDYETGSQLKLSQEL